MPCILRATSHTFVMLVKDVPIASGFPFALVEYKWRSYSPVLREDLFDTVFNLPYRMLVLVLNAARFRGTRFHVGSHCQGVREGGLSEEAQVQAGQANSAKIWSCTCMYFFIVCVGRDACRAPSCLFTLTLR